MNTETLLENKKNNDIESSAKSLAPDEIAYLISLLSEIDDSIRYASFLTLQQRSRFFPDVYPYWDVLSEKLGSQNSYQRSIAVMLLAENIRWDSGKRFSGIIENYLKCCRDEKFITSRQTIQSIAVWAKDAPELLTLTAKTLMNVDIDSLKDTQKKLIQTDIINALIAIREVKPIDEVDDYLVSIVKNEFADKKTIKLIERILSQK